MSFELLLRNIPLEIKIEEVRRYLGEYKGITEIPKEINSLIERLTLFSRTLITPSATSKSFNILSFSDNIIETEVVKLPGRDIAKLLRNSKQVIFCATTIGNTLEEEINRLIDEKRILEATILDAIGSTAADTAMDYLNNLLKAEAIRKGLSLTRRYSPGYGDFPLSIQESLVKFSGGDSIGIRVSPSYMLIPRKSVTAIIGVMKN
ncbi:MAG: methionine synthase [Synergistetes bacterium]|nr:methionine synthase [Synergistota bacterium]MCX8127546.1 methionine synthase [Synergistota bacterium]MDW8191537.1 methionine synthase [Synergistota bacterium]